jgi:hypothetical protein
MKNKFTELKKVIKAVHYKITIRLKKELRANRKIIFGKQTIS